MRIEDGFQQRPISLPPAFSGDEPLKALLLRLLPGDVHRFIAADLERFEHRLAGRASCFTLIVLSSQAAELSPALAPLAAIRALASVADSLPATIEPTLVQFNQFGERVDHLHTSEPWRTLKGIAAEEGLVSIAFERQQGEFSRLYAFSKVRPPALRPNLCFHDDRRKLTRTSHQLPRRPTSSAATGSMSAAPSR